MRKERILYQKDNEICNGIKDVLVESVFKRDWEYDFPGFIYYSELVKMINEKRIIPKGAILNGKDINNGTLMDAENYYFQTGKMHHMSELYTRNIDEKIDERSSLRLERKCPRCGKKLLLRHGKNWFWGCEGYFDIPRCTYTEQMR